MYCVSIIKYSLDANQAVNTLHLWQLFLITQFPGWIALDLLLVLLKFQEAAAPTLYTLIFDRIGMNISYL